jgi:hypothetical protein
VGVVGLVGVVGEVGVDEDPDAVEGVLLAPY